MHRGFEAFDATQLLVAIADLYPDSASGGRSLCLRVAPQLFTLFPPEGHRSADLARMLWALGVLADPTDPQLRQAAPAVSSALRHCSRDMRRMHPKYTMLAMKGMAAMARGGLPYSEGRGEGGRPWGAFLAAADTEEATAAVRSLESDTNTFAKRATGHLAASLSTGAPPPCNSVQADCTRSTVLATPGAMWQGHTCVVAFISLHSITLSCVRVCCAVGNKPRRRGLRSTQGAPVRSPLREALLQSLQRRAAAA